MLLNPGGMRPPKPRRALSKAMTLGATSLALLGSLLAAESVSASPTLAQYAQAYALSAAVQGVPPCAEGLPDRRPNIALEATGPISQDDKGSPATGWVMLAPDGRPADCIIHVLDTPAVDWGTDPVGFCLLVRHESHHLQGYSHDPDPHSLMYAGQLDRNVAPECASAGLASPPPAVRAPVRAKARPRHCPRKRGRRPHCRHRLVSARHRAQGGRPT